MIENIDLSLVDWSRAQFALTAAYHWIFVPLTLGLSFMLAFMETIYVKTGNPEWKRITKFWMTLFGINFAIGVATGIILEFEFGANWSNYSWFVGDIFGAPLAIEGIFAFFMESTFIAMMFFGWNKLSRKTHLISTWLVAFGANLSALWILVANAWMQYPAGMHFNPDTARNEMTNFWDVLFSPMAIHKFLHTITSGFVLAAIFVIGVSAWFLLKKREQVFSRRSMSVAAVFGLLTSIFLVVTGDFSSRTIARYQPMKFAATEALHTGTSNAGWTVFGIPSQTEETSMKIEIPGLLSFMTYYDRDAYVTGINDILEGNAAQGVMSAAEKIKRGKEARQVLKDYKDAKKNNDEPAEKRLRAKFDDPVFQEEYFKYFGYGFLNNPQSLVPNVPLTFWSFRVMVGLGFYFVVLFVVVLWLVFKDRLGKRRWLLWLMLLSIPLPYLAGQAGWVVAEVGRQPWAIQDYLPTAAAVSQIDAGAVQITFWLFAAIFTTLLIAEISIMLRQIKQGPKEI
ncbi:MAG: cytochrome ubiquinol oxidase subunit I [Bacteroidales bacterium]|jgi:cytochrome d ubiquinol oxidase subunit I|nr:cytochrome ubiquinol oxidase subunit I [Bacteroidales bacterium]